MRPEEAVIDYGIEWPYNNGWEDATCYRTKEAAQRAARRWVRRGAPRNYTILMFVDENEGVPV